MNDLTKLLQSIEKRPLMYLREQSLDLLDSFIGGYLTCTSLNNLENHSDNIFRNEFYYWLKERYNLASCISWVDQIREILKKTNSNKDEFDLFFELLDLFKADKLK